MNLELKKYFAEIGARGGRARSKGKASAVRRNGALGGRPRKDGIPPGSKSLNQIIQLIESSKLPPPAKEDAKLWSRSKAHLMKGGDLWLDRESAGKIMKMVLHKQ